MFSSGMLLSGGAVTLTNYAAASNGGTASASTIRTTYLPSKAIDGARFYAAGGWSTTPAWHDNNQHTFPDWLRVDFSSTRTISQIVVVGVQDSYDNPVDPDETLTSTLYGLSDFSVQYWNGSSFVNFTGGVVTGNTKVMRVINVTPQATTAIRLNITATMDGYSRVVELEAYGT